MKTELERVAPRLELEVPDPTEVKDYDGEMSGWKQAAYISSAMMSLNLSMTAVISLCGGFGGTLEEAIFLGIPGVIGVVATGSLALRRIRRHKKAMRTLEPTLDQIRDRLSGWLRRTYGLEFYSESDLKPVALDALEGKLSRKSPPWAFKTQDGALLKARLVMEDSRLELHKVEVSSPNESIYFDPIEELS